MTITMNERATITAEGKVTNMNRKPVVCTDTGEVFASVTDAAEKNGVTIVNMSKHLRNKSKSCNGKHFCFLSELPEHLDEMTTNMRALTTQFAEMQEKAAAYDAWVAEQEAKRKAEEEHQAAIEKASAKMERRQKACERLEAKLQEAIAKFIEAESELEMLKANAPAIA